MPEIYLNQWVALIESGLVVKLKLIKKCLTWLRPIKMQNELSLVSDDVLIDELCARYDHIVIAGLKVLDLKGEYLTLRRWKGNSFACVGIAGVLQQVIGEAERVNSKPMNENKDR